MSNTISTPNPPHKHKDLIIAWANGAKIQVYHMRAKCWVDITDRPAWQEDAPYRIKPRANDAARAKIEKLQAKVSKLQAKIAKLVDSYNNS